MNEKEQFDHLKSTKKKSKKIQSEKSCCDHPITQFNRQIWKSSSKENSSNTQRAWEQCLICFDIKDATLWKR